MKNKIKTLFVASTLLLNASLTYAGLDWTYGSLSNADNLKRNTKAIAYSSTGNVFVTSPPSGYHHTQIQLKAIAVNASTSEVAFCGDIVANVITPNYADENRWIIKKYGATSPRLSSTGVAAETFSDENKFTVFPNPASTEITVGCNQLANNSWQFALGDEINIMDVNGKMVKQILTENHSTQQKNFCQ